MELGNNYAHNEEGEEHAVYGEVFWETAFEAEVPHLADSDCEQKYDDDREGEGGAGLGAEVGGSEPLNGYEIERVIVQAADPCAAEPEDGSFDVCVQIVLLGLYAVSVEDCCDKSGWEEAADDQRRERGVICVCGRVGHEANVEEEHSKDCWKEDRRGRGAKGKDSGEDDGDGKKRPAEIFNAGGREA